MVKLIFIKVEFVVYCQVCLDYHCKLDTATVFEGNPHYSHTSKLISCGYAKKSRVSDGAQELRLFGETSPYNGRGNIEHPDSPHHG